MDDYKHRSKNAYVVCRLCGESYGRTEIRIKSIFKYGLCGVCNKKGLVTDFKNYGYSKY